MFGEAPYALPGSGTPGTIPGLTRDDLVAFHEGRYRPETATLVFSGDITPDAAPASQAPLTGAGLPSPGKRAAPAQTALNAASPRPLS